MFRVQTLYNRSWSAVATLLIRKKDWPSTKTLSTKDLHLGITSSIRHTQQLRTRSRNPRKSKPKVVRKSKGIIRCSSRGGHRTQLHHSQHGSPWCGVRLQYGSAVWGLEWAKQRLPEHRLYDLRFVFSWKKVRELSRGLQQSRRFTSTQGACLFHDVDPVLLPFCSSYSSSRWFLHDREYTPRTTRACKPREAGDRDNIGALVHDDYGPCAQASLCVLQGIIVHIDEKV